VHGVLRHTDVTPALEQQLLTKAQGNPFFLEELAHTLDDSGGQLRSLAVPDTVQAVIAARIDGLPAEEKHLLQAAAVIGENIAFPLLQAIIALPGERLSRHLTRLQAAEFLSAASGPHPSTYTFRHILIQETTYQSLPASTRRQYHQQIAQALAEQPPDLPETQPELLAHHYTGAGDAEQAIAYWQRASQRAVERSSYVESIMHFTTALTLLQSLPDTPERAQQELALRLALGPALIATKGHNAPEVERTYTRARELCYQVPEGPQLAQILMGLMIYHNGRGEHQSGREIGLHLLRLAERVDDQVTLLHAQGVLGLTALYLGGLGESRARLEHGIALGDHLTHRTQTMNSLFDMGVVCRLGAAWALQQLGYPEQAERWGDEALGLARGGTSPYNFCNALLFLALWRVFRREWRVGQQCIEEALHLTAGPGFRLYAAIGQIVRGATLTAQDHAQEGLTDISQGLVVCHNMGAKVLQPWGLAMLAEGYERLGQPEAGLKALSEAQALIATTHEAFYAAEIFRLQGELLTQAPDAGSGVSPAATLESCFHHAIEVSRRHQAKFWELRAAMSLSRLWRG
jgi:tetratricopeptide (TPR) repeat protein